jgi:hypothetical protein
MNSDKTEPETLPIVEQIERDLNEKRRLRAAVSSTESVNLLVHQLQAENKEYKQSIADLQKQNTLILEMLTNGGLSESLPTGTPSQRRHRSEEDIQLKPAVTTTTHQCNQQRPHRSEDESSQSQFFQLLMVPPCSDVPGPDILSVMVLTS